jgi:hypothetical protein
VGHPRQYKTSGASKSLGAGAVFAGRVYLPSRMDLLFRLPGICPTCPQPVPRTVAPLHVLGCRWPIFWFEDVHFAEGEKKTTPKPATEILGAVSSNRGVVPMTQAAGGAVRRSMTFASFPRAPPSTWKFGRKRGLGSMAQVA